WASMCRLQFRMKKRRHGLEQGFGLERLVKESSRNLLHLVGVSAAREAADRESLDRGVEPPHDVGERGSVEVGHPQVGHDNADLVAARREDGHRLDPVCGDEHTVAIPREYRGRDVADLGLVIDDADKLTHSPYDPGTD